MTGDIIGNFLPHFRPGLSSRDTITVLKVEMKTWLMNILFRRDLGAGFQFSKQRCNRWTHTVLFSFINHKLLGLLAVLLEMDRVGDVNY